MGEKKVIMFLIALLICLHFVLYIYVEIASRYMCLAVGARGSAKGGIWTKIL